MKFYLSKVQLLHIGMPVITKQKPGIQMSDLTSFMVSTEKASPIIYTLRMRRVALVDLEKKLISTSMDYIPPQSSNRRSGPREIKS